VDRPARLRTAAKALARFLVRVCHRACLGPPVHGTPATRLHCAADNHTRVQLEGTVPFFYTGLKMRVDPQDLGVPTNQMHRFEYREVI